MINTTPLPRKKKDKKRISHLTMMVIPHSHGAPTKNYCIPMWLFKSFMVLSISCILIVGYFVSGYFYLTYVEAENKELKEVNLAQAKEINELKGLAGSMKDKLEYLIKLDQEVREKVGLVQSNRDESETPQSMNSSRAEQRYKLITMGIGDLQVGQTQPMVLQMAFTGQEKGEESQAVLGTNVLQPGKVLELPIPAGEIDTLEELKEELSLMDNMLTVQSEALNKLNTDVDKQIAYLNALPNEWPLKGRITSWYGWRTNPYSRKGREFHEGIDIAASYGSPVKAAGDGVVTYSGYKGSWGRLVIISHGYGYVSQYAHNSSLLVKSGDKVKKGDIIARLGSTGRSTGPHVHFGVAKNNQWINPMDLINEAIKLR